MALAVNESGKMSLEHAQTASRQMQEGKFRSARATLARAEVSAVNHKEQISYLAQRYNAVQEHYIQKEKELTKAISAVHAKERSLESQKAAAQLNLYHQEKKRNEHISALGSAECNLSEARCKSRDANTGKIVSGIAAGLLTLATFGAAAPLVAIPFVFAELEKDAERKVEHFKNQIRSTERKIQEAERSIVTLTSAAAKLNGEKSVYTGQRNRLQEEKGKIKHTIVFLQSALSYGSQYSLATEHCIGRTASTGKLMKKVEARGYTLFDSKGTKLVLNSFEEAWKVFEDMTENGSHYNFQMEFQCSRCGHDCTQLPHVSQGSLICTECQI